MKSANIKLPSLATVQAQLCADDASIPNEVKAFFNETQTDQSETLSVAGSNGVLWLAAGNQVKQIKLKTYQEFEIHYMEAAKGAGFVAIHASPKLQGQAGMDMIDFGIYSDQALTSAIGIAKKLEAVLGYKPKQKYLGADC